ncbi:MAG: hypothetical protein AVDCRST_MAG93-7207 [uncultured Chloroflexia bacterium]|uniref:Uncharacterized protein n=1 Tax=uncultured Chloroflexia bacterium TaxID=1672391 RepID=A0A6J4M8U8_9CHLR|nr:MAG: hypothetical protein AVDCRST_MAG93-7207 [uncultured Chloroflexia bacterium]
MYDPITPSEPSALPPPEDLTALELIRSIKTTKQTAQTTSSLTIAMEASCYLQELYEEAASRRVRAR